MAEIIKRKLSDAIVEELRRSIEGGLLKSGDQLPNQSALAAQLGVSRNTLREALHTMTLAGVLDQRQGSGTFVRCTLPESLCVFLKPPAVAGFQEIDKLMDARTQIEVGNAQMAVAHATQAGITELGRLCAEPQETGSGNGVTRFVRQDADFHHALAKAAGNCYMAHLFSIIRSLMEPFLNECIHALPGILESFQSDHRRIYKAVFARDRELAAAEMVRHMIRVREAIATAYEKDRAHSPRSKKAHFRGIRTGRRTSSPARENRPVRITAKAGGY